MAQGIEAVVAVAVLLASLFAFVHGMTMFGDPAGHLWALGGLVTYLLVWVYGLIRAAYS